MKLKKETDKFTVYSWGLKNSDQQLIELLENAQCYRKSELNHQSTGSN